MHPTLVVFIAVGQIYTLTEVQFQTFHNNYVQKSVAGASSLVLHAQRISIRNYKVAWCS